MGNQEQNQVLIEPLRTFLKLSSGLLLVAILVSLSLLLNQTAGLPGVPASGRPPVSESTGILAVDTNFVDLQTAPSPESLDKLPAPQQELIRYGRELIAHTSEYLGPRGSVKVLSNGMNCQNCHLQAGTQPWGNNYLAVEATYPRFRARSGTSENQTKRISDCFERSLNGQAPAADSREMRAMLAYLQWLGSEVPRGVVPRGSGIFKLKDLDRAANPDRGKVVYSRQCQSCHQSSGTGVMAADGKSYLYPPLWGVTSYNVGAGLYRISNLAGFVKYNMPLGTTYERPVLTDEEAWDVAAYINSRPRPKKDLRHDWPARDTKPTDHPFGPYSDPYSEQQHKYGPYGPIKEWKKQHQPTTPKP